MNSKLKNEMLDFRLVKPYKSKVAYLSLSYENVVE